MKIKLSVALLVFVPMLALTQSPRTTNTPYTMYGYGELSDPSYGAQKAMGGIGYGLREKNMINPANPASFSCVDSMTFMFDLAVSGELSRFDNGTYQSKHPNARLEYVALQFPIYKNWGMGFGFKPISRVGYEFGEVDKNTIYTGSGGINQVYGALSYNFKQLAIGVNAGYLFGNKYKRGEISLTTSGSYPPLSADTLSVSGLSLDFGIQYSCPIGKKQRIVIGAVYTPKVSLNGKYSGGEWTYVFDRPTNKYIPQVYKPYSSKDTGYDLPETYAVGLSYAKGDKFLAGADYTFQKWSDVRFPEDTFNDRSKINAGCQFTPNARGREYFGRVRYRLGANYANSYISPKIEEKTFQFNEYGVSFGFGLPLTGGRSLLNMAFEYTKTNPTQQLAGAIKEEYFKFTLSYTFNELWFFQRKVQ